MSVQDRLGPFLERFLCWYGGVEKLAWRQSRAAKCLMLREIMQMDQRCPIDFG